MKKVLTFKNNLYIMLLKIKIRKKQRIKHKKVPLKNVNKIMKKVLTFKNNLYIMLKIRTILIKKVKKMSKVMDKVIDDLDVLEEFFRKEYITLNQYFQIKKKIITNNLGGVKDGRGNNSNR